MTTGLHYATRVVTAAVLAVAGCISTSAGAADTRALMVEHKCYICHEDGYSKAGPAFVDIAAAYGRDRRAVNDIANVIRRGQHGSSPWPMPPHPELTRAEARQIARYIISVRSEAAQRP